MKAGILGGTFDPIHLGHLIIAEEVRQCLGLEEVLFIPTGEPWMKAGKCLSPAHHRINMVRLAIASNPFFRVSSIEVDRPGPTYLVDTLEALHQESDGEDELHFILGEDSLKDLPRWKQPARILELCTMVVVTRPGCQELDMGPVMALVLSSDKLIFLDGPLVGVSGTDIRCRVALGLPTRYHVPDEVERYMFQYGLYRNTDEHGV